MGLGDLLEARLGLLVVRVAIGVVLASEFAVGLLDLIGARALVDAERLVVVGSRRHRLAPQAETTTRAGRRTSRRAGSRPGRPRRRSPLRAALRGAGRRDRLVERGVEALACGRRTRSPRAPAQRRARADEPHAVQQRVVPRPPLERAVEVVERGQQLLGEPRRRPAPARRPPRARRACGSSRSRPGALREREVLIALGRHLHELVDVALRSPPRRSARQRLGRGALGAAPPTRRRAARLRARRAARARGAGRLRRAGARALSCSLIATYAFGSSTTSASTTSSSRRTPRRRPGAVAVAGRSRLLLGALVHRLGDRVERRLQRLGLRVDRRRRPRTRAPRGPP